MKKIILFAILLQSIVVMSQVPQGINYQATARNTSGQILANQSVNFKFSLIQTLITNSPIYSETFNGTTDDLGHISLVIGQGTVSLGTFSSINWASGPYFLKIELNTGSAYITMGTTQLLSVPYALYASNTATKTISGTCTGGSAPSLLTGSGFTASNPSTGAYNITFSVPFTTLPTVVASTYITNQTHISLFEHVSVRNITVNGCTIYTKNSNGLIQDVPFTLIAVGQ
ncbi:hypothetical protein [Flavobacterium sp.]|jgi:hypothetical protein|uniref:hypothetical protein n=1 Tax=Flavobacterium sp. TaxID=239 RepID=UPI0037C0CAD0